jgi:hypothetical protein
MIHISDPDGLIALGVASVPITMAPTPIPIPAQPSFDVTFLAPTRSGSGTSSPTCYRTP